ncbi:MAG: GIY-YIG nuclease family protein [Cyanobacteriota bacterium]|nr:GIY-YIG nuclease family protein [Cyanobacteriota bacterium]
MSPRPEARQGDLFASLPLAADLLPEALPLERQQLLEWQERLGAFQHPLWSDGGGGGAEQASLFSDSGAGRSGSGPDPQALACSLQPLALPAETLSFWRWPQAPHAGPALYLVLDRPAHLPHPLLLYVGETARADRRWKGAHDCKSYLAAYREALAKADLTSLLTIRFWCEAPQGTAERRALEQALIQRWKPPFNKETRGRWSTPFTVEFD